MRILIIGGGGREHALAWRLGESGHTIFAAPGNPGTASIGENIPTGDYLAAAEHTRADLTVVGPEAPLVEGVVDRFRAQGRAIVGPTQANAKLEGSKVYSKRFMQDAGIPTARSVQVDSVDAGLSALASFDLPVVIKADGLMAGKGVVIAADRPEAEAAVRTLGPRLVIEEYLTGEEVSFIALSDGRNIVPLEATQDHKAVWDGDKGPNTGGMGAYCDGRIIDGATAEKILEIAIRPVVERTGFTGFLYAGLMMTPAGPRVLEYNVRLGDPETQPLMHRMDCDFGELLYAAAKGGLQGAQASWKADPSVCVVLAAHGYPADVRKGDAIRGVDGAAAQVFHAGTRIGANGLETSGGRVLGVTARGADLQSAIANAYSSVGRIDFAGMHYRKDIGGKGLKRW